MRPTTVTPSRLPSRVLGAIGATAAVALVGGALVAAPASAFPVSVTAPVWTSDPASGPWSALAAAAKNHAITVTWPAATGYTPPTPTPPAPADVAHPVTGYTVQLLDSTNHVLRATACTTAATVRTCAITALTNGTAYRFRVTARNNLAETTTTRGYSSSVIPFGRPVAPWVAMRVGVQSVTVTVGTGNGNGRPVHGYTIKLFRIGSSAPVATKYLVPSVHSVTIKGLVAGQAYRAYSYTRTSTQTSNGRASAIVVPVLPPAKTLPVRPGQRGPLVWQIQQKLNWAGLTVKRNGVMDATTVKQVRHLQEKYLLDQTGVVNLSTWRQLNDITRSQGALPSQCYSTSLCISKKQKLLRYVVNGKVLMSTDVRFGPEDDPALRTRSGQHAVYRKDRWHVSSEFHTPMYYSMFFDGGQAVHYSKFFAADGYYGHSHGCVNVRDRSAVSWLFDHVGYGTKVFIY